MMYFFPISQPVPQNMTGLFDTSSILGCPPSNRGTLSRAIDFPVRAAPARYPERQQVAVEQDAFLLHAGRLHRCLRRGRRVRRLDFEVTEKFLFVRPDAQSGCRVMQPSLERDSADEFAVLVHVLQIGEQLIAGISADRQAGDVLDVDTVKRQIALVLQPERQRLLVDLRDVVRMEDHLASQLAAWNGAALTMPTRHRP